MKRIISIALLLIMLTSVYACGSQTTGDQTTPTTSDESQTESTDSNTTSEGWVPTETIEMVIPFSAGGGSDVFARKIIEIIEKNKLTPVSIVPANKPGGSGVVGYTYMNTKGANNYVMATTSSSFYSQPLSDNSPLSPYNDFSFVSLLCKDPNLIVANPNAEFNSLQELIDYAKENPKMLKYGGTGNVSDDAILMYMLNELAGIELTYVPYDSGGEVLAAVLGGHIDLCAISPAEAGEHLTAGSLKPMAVSADERISLLPDVPTFIEEGIDIDHQQSRGVVLNAGVDQQVIDYYSDLMKRVTETEEWKTFLEENTMVDRYLPTEEYIEYNKELADEYKKFLEIVMRNQ